MRIRSLALAALVIAVVAAPAAAAPVALNGTPLNVYVDSRGQLQAVRDGGNGIFFPASSTTGDAGFFLAFPNGSGNTGMVDNKVYGFAGGAGPFNLTDYTPAPGGQGAVTGTGTAADPFTQVTTYSVATAATVTQTTTYVNGSQEFRIKWAVRNDSGAALKFKAIAAADYYFEGSDRGTGIFTQGPPRFLGGTNADTGNSGGFLEVLGAPSGSTAWTSYQALAYGGGANEVWGKVEGAAAAATNTFDNSVVGQSVDNAGAVEWADHATSGLAAAGAGATASYELIVRNAVPAALQLNPTNGGSPRGVPLNITATALDTNGQPYAGRTLRYTILGVNAGSGTQTLGSNGSAVIVDPGTLAGADTIVAYVDFNNNGSREPAEPQASALATFVDNVDPSCKVKVTGDRPGGGGAGKPLVISVNCNEIATVTVSTTLIAPSAGASASGVTGDAARKKRKKKVTIKLPTRTTNVAAGKALPVRLAIPRSVRRKYAGRKLTVKIVVKATDQSGNANRVTKTTSVKLAKIKKQHKKRR